MLGTLTLDIDRAKISNRLGGALLSYSSAIYSIGLHRLTCYTIGLIDRCSQLNVELQNSSHLWVCVCSYVSLLVFFFFFRFIFKCPTTTMHHSSCLLYTICVPVSVFVSVCDCFAVYKNYRIFLLHLFSLSFSLRASTQYLSFFCEMMRRWCEPSPCANIFYSTICFTIRSA